MRMRPVIKFLLAAVLIFGYEPREHQFYDEGLGEDYYEWGCETCEEYPAESLDFEGSHSLYDTWAEEAAENPPQLVLPVSTN